MISTFLGFLGGTTTFALIFDIPLDPTIGVWFVALHSVTVSYAIFKHQFMDIQIVIRKSLIYTLLIAFISLSYLLLVILLEHFVQQVFNYQSKFVSIAVAFGLGIFIIPLRNRIQYFVDKLVYRQSQNEMAEENQRLQVEKQKHEVAATLASGVAHEIRNPLTAIKAFCEHAKTKKDDPEFIDRFERVTFNEIDRIEQLTQQLLDFAKPSKPNFETVNVNDVIHDTLLLTQNSLKKNNMELIQNLADDLPSIQADPNQLKQALLNLILNAVDAMDDSGTLTITTTNENNRASIIITDTGCGIPSDKLDQIFHPFHSSKSHGTGLGLSIVKTIVDNHRGRINVDSKINQGTTFTLRFNHDRN